MKILTLKNDLKSETPKDRQVKSLLHTEYSLLSLLKDEDGIAHHQGPFQVVVGSLLSSSSSSSLLLLLLLLIVIILYWAQNNSNKFGNYSLIDAININ